MSQRAVLAHEYYGHKYFDDLFGDKNPLPGAWTDEFRASYNAALNAPNLTETDRMYLMADALERAKEAGVNITNLPFTNRAFNICPSIFLKTINSFKDYVFFLNS